jgi:hypothetical protein
MGGHFQAGGASIILAGLLSAAAFCDEPRVDSHRDSGFVAEVSGVSGVEPLTAACYTLDFPFETTILGKYAGEPRRPLNSVTIRWGRDRSMTLSPNKYGIVSDSLSLWWHHESTTPEPSSVRVTVRAPGCKDKKLKLKEGSRSSPIVLKCK